MTFAARAPGKLNLTLAVGPRGSDGFHALQSVFLRFGLTDRLTVEPVGEPTEEPPADTLAVQSREPCPVADNLVLAAARALRAAVPGPLSPLCFRLDKQIPLTAGLGGGSSDAAAALALAARAWGLARSPADLEALGGGLGADVPFFVRGAEAALVAGRGERIEPLPAPPELGVLLVVPAERLATRAVFEAWDEAPGTDSSAAALTRDLAAGLRVGALRAEEAGQWAERLRDANDLWPAALRLSAALGRLRSELEERLGRAFLLSGSGPSLFTLYASGVEAASAAETLSVAESPALTVVATSLRRHDPIWRSP